MELNYALFFLTQTVVAGMIAKGEGGAIVKHPDIPCSLSSQCFACPSNRCSNGLPRRIRNRLNRHRGEHPQRVQRSPTGERCKQGLTRAGLVSGRGARTALTVRSVAQLRLDHRPISVAAQPDDDGDDASRDRHGYGQESAA